MNAVPFGLMSPTLARFVGLAIVVSVSAAIAACGQSPVSPAKLRNAFLGVWEGTLELESASGGGCVVAALQARVLSNPVIPVTIEITESDNDYDDLAGRVSNLMTTRSCELRGSVLSTGTAQFVSSQCEVPTAVRCDTGELAEFDVSSPSWRLAISVLIFVSGGSARGLISENWDVMINGESIPESKDLYLRSALPLKKVRTSRSFW